jgi:hypothetical protein
MRSLTAKQGAPCLPGKERSEYIFHFGKNHQVAPFEFISIAHPMIKNETLAGTLSFAFEFESVQIL